MGGTVAYGDPFGIHSDNNTSDTTYLTGTKNRWRQLGGEGVKVLPGQDQGQQNDLNQSTAQQQQSQQQGYDAMGLMRAQALGGQTPAMQQASQALQYSDDAQRAMVANAGSGQALAAARSRSASNSSLLASNTANQQRALAAQEQQTGMQQYGSMANSMRNNAQNMYGDQNDYNYQTAQQQMQLRQANDQLMLGYSGLSNSLNAGQEQIALGQAQQNINAAQSTFNTVNQGVKVGAGFMSGAAGYGGGGSGGGGSGGGDRQFWSDVGPDDGNNWGSDERLKTGVVRGGLMSNFLDTLAHSRATYKYKNPADEPRSIPTGGRYAGVMAQDLERVPEIGHQLVIDTPHGKYVDQKTMTSALSAGLGEIHERVRRLEGRR